MTNKNQFSNNHRPVTWLNLSLVAMIVFVSAPTYAESCSDALDPNLKSFMENIDAKNATAAFGHWATTKEGSSWTKSNDQNADLGFLGSFKLDIGYGSRSGDSGNTSRETSTQTQQSFSNQQLSTLRQAVATADQWKSYQTCILAKYPAGRIITGSLEQTDGDDWHPVTLKLASNRSSDVIPTAIVTSMKVYGADPTFENWTGRKVSEDLTQILVRQANKALTVNISTTLGSYTESLKAVKDVLVVPIHAPYCDPCALFPVPPNGAFCLGRFSQYWASQLASHGLSAEDGEGLPVRLRTTRLMAQCHALVLTGTLQSPPPPAIPNETQVAYQQRMDQLRLSIQNQASQVQRDISDFESQLTRQGDRWFRSESYQLPDAVTFCQRNAGLCSWGGRVF